MLEPKTNAERVKYWFIMFHPKPEWIDEQLRKVNRQLAESHLEQFDYVIPYLHLSKVDPERVTPADASPDEGKATRRARRHERFDEAELNNSLRSYLHYYVFIKSSALALHRLVNEPWNRNDLYRLSFRYSYGGDYLRMTDDDMTQLNAIIAHYQYKFGLREYSDDIPSTVKVRMKNRQFRGMIGTVLEVVHDGRGTHLTIGIPAFHDQLLMELTDISTDEFEVVGGSVDDVLSPSLVSNIEDTIVRVLRQRVRRQEDHLLRKENRLLLDTHQGMLQVLCFDDAAMTLHLLALKLLNAALLGDAVRKRQYITEVQQALHNLEAPADDGEALLLAALFVATRKGSYRKTLKDYLHQHEPSSKTLLRLMPILKDITTR